MSTMTHMNDGAAAEWAKAKTIHETRGITAPQLLRYARGGQVRTSNIVRPGQGRGTRLFHLGDVDRLIESNIETFPGSQPETK